MNKHVQKVYAAIGALDVIAGGNCLINNFTRCDNCEFHMASGHCAPRLLGSKLRKHLNENREVIEKGILMMPRKEG